MMCPRACSGLANTYCLGRSQSLCRIVCASSPAPRVSCLYPYGTKTRVSFKCHNCLVNRLLTSTATVRVKSNAKCKGGCSTSYSDFESYSSQFVQLYWPMCRMFKLTKHIEMTFSPLRSSWVIREEPRSPQTSK